MNPILKTAANNRENQDRGAVVNVGSGVALVIADGAGGLSGGAEAATMTVELIRQHTERLSDAPACATLLRMIDEQVLRGERAGETTCVLAVVRKNQIFGASVGDSGAWIVGSTTVTDLTRSQARKPFIGSGGASPLGFTCESWMRGDKLLLATDGLLKYTSAERIIEVCRERRNENCAAHLIELVRYPSGDLPDDVTVVIATL